MVGNQQSSFVFVVNDIITIRSGLYDDVWKNVEHPFVNNLHKLRNFLKSQANTHIQIA